MAVGLVFLSSGCADGLFGPAPRSTDSAALPAPRPAARPARVTQAARPNVSLPVPIAPVPVTPVSAAPLPVVELPPPVDLAGVSAVQLEALLGMPANRTLSGTGERWTYRAEDCAVDVFLFPDVARGGLIVLDRRASGSGGEQQCLRRLRDARVR